MITIEPLSPGRLTTWAALFEASSSSCYCRYWHFEGDKNAWLARSAFEAKTSLEEQIVDVHNHDDRGRGLIALDETETCVGWMKLSPRAALPKLRRLPVYRNLNLGTDEGAWSIGCVLVHPLHRKRGVANAMISNATKFAREWGAKFVEAYPHVQPVMTADEQMWRGVISSFVRAGFREIAGERPYPVLRKECES